MDRCPKCGAWLTYPCYETNGSYNYDFTGVCIVCGYKETFAVTDHTKLNLNTDKALKVACQKLHEYQRWIMMEGWGFEGMKPYSPEKWEELVRKEADTLKTNF